MIEVVQVVIIGVGVTVTIGWWFDSLMNLRAMYRAGVNGVLEQLAIEKTIVAALHLFLQGLWFLSALRLSRLQMITEEGETMKQDSITRAFIGSLLIFSVVLVKRWSWNRIRKLDGRL